MGYIDALLRELGTASPATGYTSEVAWYHYCLSVVDYSRMVFGCFFKGASPDAFNARADKENVGLAYRNIDASFLFVERVDRCLRAVEERFSELPTDTSRDLPP